MKRNHQPPPRPGSRLKLVWSRRDLIEATGLSYRSLANLETRGLLRRVHAGVNVALYSHASVCQLFGDGTPQPASPALDSPPDEAETSQT